MVLLEQGAQQRRGEFEARVQWLHVAVAQLGVYSAAKAAVIALTRSIAIEEKGNGVRVNIEGAQVVDGVLIATRVSFE